MKIVILSYLMFISLNGLSQTYSFPQMGQLPTSAFPLCTIDTFRQLIQPYGDGGFVSIPGCGPLALPNPYYYKFTCYTSGKLALLVLPLSDNMDYNWELFDITDHDPNDIYTNGNLAIVGNWSGTYGRTGAGKNGLSSLVCLSSPAARDSTFTTMPDLIQGHHYLLLVTCYSQFQNDYEVSFAGSTAGIANLTHPQIQSAYIGCNKKSITVVINKQMRCYSITSDGSLFDINSPNVHITSAFGIHCNDQFDFDTLQLSLSDTLAPGNYILSVKSGNDGKIIWDDCFNSLQSGEKTGFTVSSSRAISADFNYQINYGCISDTTFFKYQPVNGTDQSLWYVDTSFFSSQYEPYLIKSDFSSFTVQHIVSNGFCTDTATSTIKLDNLFKAAFQSPDFICPGDLAAFHDSSIGNIVSWKWSFGDGSTSLQEIPPAHLFPKTQKEQKYLVTLEIENDVGCFDTVIHPITQLQSCYITVPNAFTPNGDGINDYLYPLNAFTAADMQFMVFNRFGQVVFETRNWAVKWDGTINGKLAPVGAYIWTLRYSDGLTGKKVFNEGASVLIR